MLENIALSPAVHRLREKIVGDASRVITRLFMPDDPQRVARIIQRVLDLPDVTAEQLLAQVMLDFANRHQDISTVFAHHLHCVKASIADLEAVSATKQALIGAYFTMEYSIESAALFNPSIVPHPDQSHLENGAVRFVMSLRATGEGHLSSIVFRSGVLDAHDRFTLDPISDYVVTPKVHYNAIYDLTLFTMSLDEMGADYEVIQYLRHQLLDSFSYEGLKRNIELLRADPCFSINRQEKTFASIFWLADSNYTVSFDPDQLISERVIFPTSKTESRGIEDARFVQFCNDQGEMTYYATYTAYNGVSTLPQLIETKDFVTFKISTLNGKAVQNKGMALFPRQIQGRYVMLARQDGENNRIMFSDHLYFWHDSYIIQQPAHPWEFIQLGNCGSPLETSEGWIVLTHGVGPMRQYCISAILLDLENPSRVIATLPEPLLIPRAEEREGYVPNVVYSCGSLIHNQTLVIPYAMSDVMSGIATVRVDDLLRCMVPVTD
ncbi:MAG: glycoside hydrolase family 130 protein [Armatimonadetes bacterium]|nr:glycoside hydrolase family 130 protein [Anaerolineae bacterium]